MRDLTPTEHSLEERPSQDHGSRFGWDQRIRSRGYTIRSRPARGEPIWERDGRQFTHSEVLRREKIHDTPVSRVTEAAS